MKPYFFARRSSESVNGVQKNVREKREMNDFERVKTSEKAEEGEAPS